MDEGTEKGTSRVRAWRPSAFALVAVIALALIGLPLAIAPALGGPQGYNDLCAGKEPSSHWRLHPLMRARYALRKNALLKAWGQAVKTGASLEAARSSAQELCWAHAILPQDASIAAALLWASAYASPLLAQGDRGGLYQGQRAVARGFGPPSVWPPQLLASAVGAGLFTPTEGLVLVSEARRHLPRGDDEQGLRFSEAALRFLLRPDELCARYAKLAQGWVRPEAERFGIAIQVLAEGWRSIDFGAAGSVARSKGMGDPWLGSFYKSLNAADGVESFRRLHPKDNGAQLAVLLSRSTPEAWPDKVPEMSAAFKDGMAIGRFVSTVPGVDIDFAQVRGDMEMHLTGSDHPPQAPVLGPFHLPDGRIPPEGLAISLLASDALAELPQSGFAPLAVAGVYGPMGYLRPDARWRTADPARLCGYGRFIVSTEGLLERRGTGWIASVRLWREGEAGAWKTRPFKRGALTKAPAWLAETAAAMVDAPLQGALVKDLAKQAFKTEASLAEFGALMQRRGLELNAEKRWRELEQFDPGTAVLRYSSSPLRLNGQSRLEALFAAAGREPWRVLTATEAARASKDQGKYVYSGLQHALSALEKSPCDPEASRAAANCLVEMNAGGELYLLYAMQLAKGCHSAVLMREAAAAELRWAWWYRGTQFASKVSPFGWDCVDYASKFTKDIIERGLVAHPDDPDLLQQRIELARISSQDRDLVNGWFTRALKARPDDRLLFETRLDCLAPKWGGQAADHLRFARENRDVCPSLLARAHRDQWISDPDHYRRDPSAWPEHRDSLLAGLNGFPEDLPAWEKYFEAAAEAGVCASEWKDLGALLRRLGADKKLDPLITVWAYRGLISATEDPGSNPAFKAAAEDALELVKTREVQAGYRHAARAAVEGFPDNDMVLTMVARNAIAMQDLAMAKWVMMRLKGRWEGAYWSRKDYDDAMKYAEML